MQNTATTPLIKHKSHTPVNYIEIRNLGQASTKLRKYTISSFDIYSNIFLCVYLVMIFGKTWLYQKSIQVFDYAIIIHITEDG